MSKRYEANLRSFQIRNPRASALLSCTLVDNVKVVDTSGEKNLVNKRYPKDTFYHSPEGPMKEALEWVKSLHLHNIKVLCIYGIGLGYCYKALISWLREDSSRYVIFLEDDLAVIDAFLHEEVAKALFDDRQAQLYFIENSPEGLEVIQSIIWGIFPEQMEISSLPFYKKMRLDVYTSLEERLQYEISEIHAVLDEYLAYGVPFFRNFWRNLQILPSSKNASALKSVFKKIPAIVVAAGPSLTKHLKILENCKDKALILAGGSSVNVLTDHGITPHFSGGVDPNPAQYLRLRQSTAFQTPFFYRERILHEALQQVWGKKLYLKGGDGYNITEWFEEKLKIRGSIIGGGHSITNCLIELAAFLGCSPIILVGFDLAYGPELELYARGVHESSAISPNELDQSSKISYKDKWGNSIVTEWKWVVEAHWIEDFAQKTKRVKIINATEGGLGFKGVKDMPFFEVYQKLLQQSYDMDAFVAANLADCPDFTFTMKDISKLMAIMYDSLSRAITHIDDILYFISAKKNKKTHTSQGSYFQHPDFIFLMQKLENEAAFGYILDVFHRMKVKLDTSRKNFIQHPKMKREEEARFDLDIGYNHFNFLKEVALVNQVLIGKSIAEAQVQGLDVSQFCPKSEVLWK